MKKIGYLFYFLTIILALNYCAYLIHVAPISKFYPDDPNQQLEHHLKISHEFVRHVGYVDSSKKNHFTYYLPEKSKGVFRIGTFGGSFVFNRRSDNLSSSKTKPSLSEFNLDL